jgi:hypothetical protein
MCRNALSVTLIARLKTSSAPPAGAARGMPRWRAMVCGSVYLRMPSAPCRRPRSWDCGAFPRSAKLAEKKEGQEMTKLLQQAFEEAEKLPEDEQNAIAARLLEEIESEQRWDGAFAKSGDLLTRLAEEALAEHRAGLTQDLDPDHL